MMFKVLFILISLWHCSATLKILVALPATFRSHYQFGAAISKALAAKGHEVTVVSPFEQSKPLPPNYKEVFLELTQDAVSALSVDQTEEEDGHSIFTCYKIVAALIALKNKISVSITNSRNFQRLLQSGEHFDLVLVETIFCDEILGLGHHFKAPTISISPVMESTELYGFSAIPALKSFVPNIYNSYTDKMDFWLRLHNTLTYIGIHYVLRTPRWRQFQRNYEQMFNPVNPPSLQDLKRNVSLILLNSHSILIPSRPMLPNIVEIGGLAVEAKPQVLPTDIQTFLDEANAGAVYFSLGSIVNTSRLTKRAKRAILGAFQELSKLRFLVKGDIELQMLSQDMSNVMVRSWLPQQAIVRHKNVKCCITQGGINSIQESIYNSKPVIVIPFYFDQFINGRWADESGYGIELPFSQMTQSKLKSTIERILHNSSYERRAQITSEIYRDRLVPPMETAIYWVEYVAATKGAPHLHSIATHFHTFHYYNLDVWAVLILSVMAGVFISWKAVSLAKRLMK